MTKAAAKKEELVERVVTGPKGIHCHDPKTGERVFAKVGGTVFLPLRSAKKFARYLEAPGVAAAKAEVAAAEAEANAGAEGEGEGEEGDGSAES